MHVIKISFMLYIPKIIIKILSALKLFFSVKIQHDIQFDNLLVSHSYSVQVSIYAIICRTFSIFSRGPRLIKIFFPPLRVVAI
jgi:hypothetical protein